MTGFVFAGPVFDSGKAEDMRSFRTFALVLIVSRAILIIQYTIVSWQNRQHRKATLPLILTIFINHLAAVGFLIAQPVFPAGGLKRYYPIFLYNIFQNPPRIAQFD
jgi:hypothetical protein